MTEDAPHQGRGGARFGAGRPRTRVEITIPRDVMEQLEQIAEWRGATVLDCVREALLSFIADQQAEHDEGT